MGRVVWVGAAAVTTAFVVMGATGSLEPNAALENEEIEIGYAEPDVGEPIAVVSSLSGSALATAAFGMEALQPETYDGALVMDLIDASHLEDTAKLRLSVNLAAAEAGRADLDAVLSDVRVALAVE